MKIQQGYLTEESGAWIGHFSKWAVDPRTGEKKRRQIAFKVAAIEGMTKTAARELLRDRMVDELGLTADNRVTLEYFITHRWQPKKEVAWRDSTRQTNLELLKIITGRFGSPFERPTVCHSPSLGRSLSARCHPQILPSLSHARITGSPAECRGAGRRRIELNPLDPRTPRQSRST
jgi:hypothetical protein